MTSSTPCVFQSCGQDGAIIMRSYMIKQARLTHQVPGWVNDTIINVCETHAAIVNRDRSCCVEGCPIVVSEFSLPAILHRPLPFRLKEGTPHRFLCLGHNLRYIDTLRKPMAAAAVSDAINNNNSKRHSRGGNNANAASSGTTSVSTSKNSTSNTSRSSRQRSRRKSKEKDVESSDEEDDGEEDAEEEDVEVAESESGGDDNSNVGEDKSSEEDGEDDEKSDQDVEIERYSRKKDSKKRERRRRESSTNEADSIDKAYEMEIEDSAVPKSEEPGRRSMRVKRARQLAEEEETTSKRRQGVKQEEAQQEIWTFEHDSIPSLTLSSVPTTPQKSQITAKLRPRGQKKLSITTSPPSLSPLSPSTPSPITPPSNSSSPLPQSPIESPTSPPASPDSQLPPKDRRCWFPNCFKADRTIRILRPAQINTCKSHLQKQETLLRGAINSNRITLVEGDGKDQVCAVCIDYYTTPDHWVCSNDSCSFIYCKKCVDFITRRRSTPKKERWICWACEAAAIKGKPKERSHFIALVTQQPVVKNTVGRVLRNSNSSVDSPHNSAPPSPSTPITPSTPSTPLAPKRIGSPPREVSENSNTSSRYSHAGPPSPIASPSSAPPTPVHSSAPLQPPSPQAAPHTHQSEYLKPKSGKEKKRQRPPPITLPVPDHTGDSSASPTSPPSPPSPPLPTDVPLGTTTQSAIVQYLMSTTLSSLRHFAPNSSREDKQRINSLYECTKQLKTLHADLPFPEYSNIWDYLRDVANLLSSELEASLVLQRMTEEGTPAPASEASDELIYNKELDQDISRIQDFKDIGDQFRYKYKEVSWRLKEVAEQVGVLEEARQKDLENVLHRKVALQELTAKEIATLEEELNANTREEENFRTKEKVLLDQLRQIRGQLARNDTTRRALQRWLEDMRQKNEGTSEEIMLAENSAIRQHEAVLVQGRSMQLMTQLIDGMYWLHTRQYGPQMQLNENYIGNKMRTLERGYRLSIGTAFSNKHGEVGVPQSGTLMIYHKLCLSHEVPKDHLERPDRLRVAISVIHELQSICPNDIDIFTNPPEVEQRYLYLVHDPRYVNKLRSLIPITTPTAPPPPPPALSLPVTGSSTPPSASAPPSPPQPEPQPPAPEPPRTNNKSNLLHIDYLLDVQTESDVQRAGHDASIPNGSESPSKNEEEEERDPNLYDTFVSPLSLQAAFRAAGAVCEAVDAVMRGTYTRAFCAVRPPGHHVGRMGRTKNVPSQGFCLLNNVAIGAKYALFTTGLERIAIVDFDVHHGNGTQEVLEGDSNFMFFSIHVHDPKKFFYPGTGGECTPSECGSCESATGTESFDNVVNVPLRRNATSNTFLAAFSQRIIQGLLKFSPQLILLSAGFDGHRDDPTNGLRLAEEDYHTITKLLKRVAKKCCQGRIVSVLEGGYALEGRNSAFRRSVSAHLKALVQDDDDYEDEEAINTTEATRATRQFAPKKVAVQSLLL